MTEREIESLQELNTEIENFIACYEGNELWGGDAAISPQKLISFMIEHPHLQEIANKIQKLKKNV